MALQCICRVIRRNSMTMKAHTYYIIFGRPPVGGGASALHLPPPAAPLHYVASGRSWSIPAVAVDVDDACRRVAATLVAARAVFDRDADERWRLLLLVPRGVVVVVVVVVVGGRQESAVRALAARVAGARRVAAARRGRGRGGGGGGYHGDGRAGARTRRYTLRVAHRRRRTSARCTRHAPPQTRQGPDFQNFLRRS